jgi:hypothetical protein
MKDASGWSGMTNRQRIRTAEGEARLFCCRPFMSRLVMLGALKMLVTLTSRSVAALQNNDKP